MRSSRPTGIGGRNLSHDAAMNYRGVIIAESLEDPSVLQEVRILETKVEPVTADHKTPWLEQWTLHTVEIPEDRADEVAEKISKVLDTQHQSSWYADFKNDALYYIIFQNRVFRVDRSKKEKYTEIVRYGTSLGIPEYQLDFSSDIKEWER